MMKSLLFWIVIAGVLGSASAVSAATDLSVSGDQGWYVIHCNIYGADVYLDDHFVGTIPQGTLTVPALTNGNYTTLTVRKNGYTTSTQELTVMPGKGQSIDLYATLNLQPQATTSIGGDMGWYIVRCNINGATVFFDGTDKGTIGEGLLYVPVYTTGTPYQQYTVKKDGYSTFVGTIKSYPGKGESVDLYATLNPVSAPTASTQGGIGGDIGWYVVHSNVNGAMVSFDNETKGTISEGILRVQVYVTGTPYKSFTVTKSGYTPFTGLIDRYPAKGETVDLIGTLSVVTPTETSATKSPLPLEITCIAIILVAIGIIRNAGKGR
jgi:hypothetical protein